MADRQRTGRPLNRRDLLGASVAAVALAGVRQAHSAPVCCQCASGPIDGVRTITDYRPVRWTGRLRAAPDQAVVVIREFLYFGEARLLTVDPTTLAVTVQPATAIETAVELEPGLAASRYHRLLRSAATAPYPLENAGLRHADRAVGGAFLTVDLCPASRPLERRLFTALAQLETNRPVPVALGISGRWLKRHPSEIAWLLGLETERQLDLIWLNHSLTHFFEPSLPYAENFMLHQPIDLTAEILGLEQLLIVRGLTPSIFFRFPGLVSNRALVVGLACLGLAVIGADAWLAKGEPIRDGSIILVHGNGNEPGGVNQLLHAVGGPNPPHFLALPTLIS